MAKLLGMSPMLSVVDLKKTMDFYVNTLGFACINTFGAPEVVWCCLERDSVEIMFNQPGGEAIRGIPAKAKDFQVFYFKPDDVAGLHAAWKKKGVTVTDLRVTVYGMKEFEVRDPDGYWLWFGQETDESPTGNLEG